jgi:acetyl-CoA carboxylase biotin carboxyl carrier protein
MDLRKIKTLIDLVSESGIAELEITEGEDKVRIVKTHFMPNAMQAHSQQMGYVAQQLPQDPALNAAMPESEPEEPRRGHLIKSPMVGTFYRAPSPGADPFVEVGSPIKEGAPICIIEAMKLLNEFESD